MIRPEELIEAVTQPSVFRTDGCVNSNFNEDSTLDEQEQAFLDRSPGIRTLRESHIRSTCPPT